MADIDRDNILKEKSECEIGKDVDVKNAYDTASGNSETDSGVYDTSYIKTNGDKGASSGVASAFEWLDMLVISLAAVVFVFTMLFGKVSVSGDSMLNTLHNGDQLIITCCNYTPKCGDIVILAKNCSKTELGQFYADKPLVKRIVATEGQTVEIKDGYLYVDDVKQQEDYARTLTEDNGFVGKQTVPKGCIFVLGDNRGDSADSRILGFIEKQYVMGKVLCRVFPFNSITSF